MVKKSHVVSVVVIFLILSFGVTANSEDRRESMPPLPKENGKVLYEFLNKEAPELMAQIPCACCGEMLDWCYEGGCSYG